MVILCLLCILALCGLAYWQGRVDGNKQKQGLKNQIEFLNSFSWYLQEEQMIKGGELDPDAPPEEKAEVVAMPWLYKLSLYKVIWLKEQEKKNEVSSMEDSEEESGSLE